MPLTKDYREGLFGMSIYWKIGWGKLVSLQIQKENIFSTSPCVLITKEKEILANCCWIHKAHGGLNAFIRKRFMREKRK